MQTVNETYVAAFGDSCLDGKADKLIGASLVIIYAILKCGDVTLVVLYRYIIQLVGWLVAKRPSNMRVYLRDGSAQAILHAATLR